MWRLWYSYSILIRRDSYTSRKAECTLDQYLKINSKNYSKWFNPKTKWDEVDKNMAATPLWKISPRGITWRLKNEFEILGWFIDLQISITIELFERYRTIGLPLLMWESPSALPAGGSNLAKLHIYKYWARLSGHFLTIRSSCWIVIFFPPFFISM